MKNYILFFFLIISLFSISGCAEKTLYLTPEATGYIYDSKTKKPLKNVGGYIGFFLPDEKSTFIEIDNDGHFSINPITKTYYFFEPNVVDYTHLPPVIYISFKHYENKKIDYSKAYTEQIPEGKSSFEHYKTIDLGVIYLDPIKEL